MKRPARERARGAAAGAVAAAVAGAAAGGAGRGVGGGGGAAAGRGGGPGGGEVGRGGGAGAGAGLAGGAACGGGGAGAGRAAPGASGVPSFLQNFAPGGFCVPQVGQETAAGAAGAAGGVGGADAADGAGAAGAGASAAPHFLQKRALAWFAVPQAGQARSPPAASFAIGRSAHREFAIFLTLFAMPTTRLICSSTSMPTQFVPMKAAMPRARFTTKPPSAREASRRMRGSSSIAW